MRKAYHQDIEITVFDDVYEPAEDTELLAKHVNPSQDSEVLDMGCGSGIISIIAARNGAKVTASDLNQSAFKNTQLNAAQHQVRVKTVQSDLFQNLPDKYDYVYFNPPYVPSEAEDEKLRQKHPQLSKAWDGGEQGRQVIREFIKQLPKHLKKNGQCLLVVSSKNDLHWALDQLSKHNMTARVIDEEHLFFETLHLLKITHKT